MTRNLGANESISFLNWTQEMLICLCLLCGCDYVPSIPRLGTVSVCCCCVCVCVVMHCNVAVFAFVFVFCGMHFMHFHCHLCEWVSDWVTEWLSALRVWVSERMCMSECVSEWVSESLNVWMSERISWKIKCVCVCEWMRESDCKFTQVSKQHMHSCRNTKLQIAYCKRYTTASSETMFLMISMEHLRKEDRTTCIRECLICMRRSWCVCNRWKWVRNRSNSLIFWESLLVLHVQ